MDMSGTLDAFERKLTGQINMLEKRVKRLEGINGHFAMLTADLDAKLQKASEQIAKLTDDSAWGKGKG